MLLLVLSVTVAALVVIIITKKIITLPHWQVSGGVRDEAVARD